MAAEVSAVHVLTDDQLADSELQRSVLLQMVRELIAEILGRSKKAAHPVGQAAP